VISSLLIANRGEIAVRIIRTARRLGIHTVAVYSDADRDACHVAAADEAVRIGPAAARDSYLRADAIMEAATRTGAAGVHPGYGFLSEKPELAALCAAAGICFVGPSADRIAAMGPKIGAKLIAARAGVAGVPGYVGGDQSDARLVDEAHRIGFPVMVKASAGGGGRGMRRVFSPAELLPALDLARREAEAAFGDPALLIERLVLRPRHLEVQVGGDKFGSVVHLFERDCSVQRNNQKVLEEAPAPNLAPAIRAKLLERGVALARTIAYDNLGTVEFILEEGQDEPWFLEMNTRLQVEHPVTEAITGLDLVEWQIRIASGEPLPLSQDAITEHGHAIEARITAERADLDFRPDSGKIFCYREPPSIRVDSGVATGSEVTLFYDSLLAKAIAGGADREAARASLVAGLKKFPILGPATTIAFLIDALEHEIFARCLATTRFIEDAFPTGWQPAHAHFALARAAAGVLALPVPKPATAWTALTGFRILAAVGGLAEARVVATTSETTATVDIAALPGGWRRVRCDGAEWDFLLHTTGPAFEVESGGRIFSGMYHRDGELIFLTLAGEAHCFTITSQIAAAAPPSVSAGSGAVLATMPGVIADVKVAVGDQVEAGQVVVVLESMKMFASHPSAISGTVVEVACRAGQTVQAGAPLIRIEAIPPG
jgi:3-methylcrotonyl-CoA carboxylase alpha subunit